MGEKETLTLSVHHPPTPPTRELPFNLHRLVAAPATEIYNHPYQNPPLYRTTEMDHQSYHTNQYVGAQYPDPHSQVGLGIHYVSHRLQKHNVAAMLIKLQHGYEHSSPGYYPSDGHPSHMGSPVSYLVPTLCRVVTNLDPSTCKVRCRCHLLQPLYRIIVTVLVVREVADPSVEWILHSRAFASQRHHGLGIRRLKK
jgi:hypothetical protein